MTKDPDIIKATFLAARGVPSRGVVTFSFDVATEHATAALSLLGGFPAGGEAVWVAIARLTPEAAAKPSPEPKHAPHADAVDQSNREYDRQLRRERYDAADEGRQAVTRSALLCEDADFWRWLGLAPGPHTSVSAAVVLRSRCGIDSRRELATDADALARFLKIEADFKSVQRFGPHAATR